MKGELGELPLGKLRPHPNGMVISAWPIASGVSAPSPLAAFGQSSKKGNRKNKNVYGPLELKEPSLMSFLKSVHL